MELKKLDGLDYENSSEDNFIVFLIEEFCMKEVNIFINLR